jgi:hypothetical protein
MKKLFYIGFALLVFAIPTMGQIDHDYNPNDKIPATGANLKKDQVPASVMKALSTDFNLSDPQTWTKFPYALKEYGWVYDSAGTSDIKPDRYQISMKTNSGHDLYAVYSAEGVLIATREVSVDVTLPLSVKQKLAKSIYKDWSIVGNKEIIKYFHDKKYVEQHIRVTVAKDNVKRTLSFNYRATDDGTADK